MCWAAEGWLEMGGSSVAPCHVKSAMERSGAGAANVFLTAGGFAVACEGLGSGKEEWHHGTSFPENGTLG